MKLPKVKMVVPKFSRDKKKRVSSPLRISRRTAKDEKYFGPVATKEQTFGSAQEVLGVILSPNTRYIEQEGVRETIAFFSSYDNSIKRLTKEIEELTRQSIESNDEHEKEKSWGEIETRTRRIGAQTRAIAYFELPTPDNLFKVMGFVDKASFLLRSFPRNVEPFTERLERVKSWGVNRQYTNYLDDFRHFVTQTKDPSLDLYGLRARDLVYWTEAGQLMPDPIDITASLYGKIVTRKEAGWFLFEVMERYPLSIISRYPLTFRQHRGNPFKLACPKAPFFEDDYYVVDNRAYKIFKPASIPFDETTLNQILSLDVDLLVCVDSLEVPGKGGRRMYATALLRASSEIVEGRFPKLDSIARQLRRYRWSPLTSQDLRHAFQAFVPGSDILHPSVWLKLHQKLYQQEAEILFETMRFKIDAGKATSEGNFFIGFQDGDRNSPVFVDAESRLTSVAIVAQQGSGKTTSGWGIITIPRTPYSLAIHTSTARGEGAPLWAKDFAGNVLNIKLEDVPSDLEPKEVRLMRQEKLNRDAESKAHKLVSRLKDQWKQTGKPVGLPLVIRPVKDTTAYIVFASTLFKDFGAAWEECFIPQTEAESQQEETVDLLTFATEETEKELISVKDDPTMSVVFIDDASNLDVEAEHAFLDDIPRKKAQTFREEIAKAMFNFRKRNMALVITHHDIEAFQKHYPMGALSALILIDLDKKKGAKKATIYDPKAKGDWKVVVKNVDWRLPPYLLNRISRIEDRV